LVGFTDGDGCFSIYYDKGKYSFYYKIGQSKYNTRVLHYIKTNLGAGSITKDNNQAQFRITDTQKMVAILFPIFAPWKDGGLVDSVYQHSRPGPLSLTFTEYWLLRLLRRSTGSLLLRRRGQVRLRLTSVKEPGSSAYFDEVLAPFYYVEGAR
jgi:hypothetical protein